MSALFATTTKPDPFGSASSVAVRKNRDDLNLDHVVRLVEPADLHPGRRREIRPIERPPDVLVLLQLVELRGEDVLLDDVGEGQVVGCERPAQFLVSPFDRLRHVTGAD